jgi:hypothetical protein
MHQDGEQDVAWLAGQRGIDRPERRTRLVRFLVRGKDGVDHGASAFA